MSERLTSGRARLPSVRIGAIVAVALAVGFVVWLVVRGNDNPSSTSTSSAQRTTASGPSATTPGKLRALAAQVGHPIYWAGPEANHTYELTRTAGGRIFVRYLPRGVPIGIRRAAFTIVGTYPFANALGVLRALSRKPGEKRVSASRGGFAVYNRTTPTNIYVAYPGSNLQIEVYDPSPRRARQLVISGQLAPVR